MKCLLGLLEKDSEVLNVHHHYSFFCLKNLFPYEINK